MKLWLIVTLSLACSFVLSAQTPALITEADVRCVGAFNTIDMNVGPLTTIEPITMRTVNGEDRWITFDGLGFVGEQIAPPQLSPCNVDPSQAAQATLVQNWGQFPPVHNSVNAVPGQNAAYVVGLSYASDSNWLMPLWSPTYAGIPSIGINAFAGAVMDDASKTLKLAGCWGVSNVPAPRIASGVIDIPDELRAALPGMWKLIGVGGAVGSVQLGPSLGPYLQAIPKPMANACPDGVDNPIQGGPILSNYPANANGPTITDNVHSGTTLGQVPTNPPTAPFHAWTGYTGYSTNKYPVDWEPWVDNGAKHGWFTTDTTFRLDSYNDGMRRGIFLAAVHSSGWMNTTVSAAPTPTMNTTTFFPTITFAVPDVSTHDGHVLQAGDLLYVETCKVGVDPGCDSDINGRNISFVVVDSVGPNGTIVGRVTSPDFASHYVPVVGGHVYLGSMYHHGSPIPSRFSGPMAQVYDPRQLLDVINKTREPYEVRYANEFDLSRLISGFGCPGCSVPGMKAVGSDTGSATHYGPVAVIANAPKRQIAVVMAHGKFGIGITAHTIYILQIEGGGGGTTPPPPTDPCVTTPLKVTNIRWPSGQTGNKSGTWNSGTFTLVEADFKWNPLRFEAKDSRGCSVTVVR